MSCSDKNTIEEKIKEMTDCPICFDVYKDPKILPCIHTFCMKCLSETWEKMNTNPKDTMPCPICRKEFAIPETGFGLLQKNFFVDRLIEIRQVLKPSSSISFCDPCLEERESNVETDVLPAAEMYCVDCHQKLCKECYRHHKKNKMLKTHNIITLNDEQIVKVENMQKAFSVSWCETHNKILENYCSGCQVVVCTMCVNESHKQHDWVVVGNCAADFRNEMKTAKEYRHLSSVMPDLGHEVDYLVNYKTEIVRSIDEIQSNVNRRREELKELVDKHADSILTELDTIRQENLKEFEQRKEDVETLFVCLKSFTAYCEQISEYGSNIDICKAKSELDGRLKELQELYGSCGKSSYQLSYVSLKLKNLQDYWKSPHQNMIGQLNVRKVSYPDDNSSELCTRLSEEEVDKQHRDVQEKINSSEEEERDEFHDCAEGKT